MKNYYNSNSTIFNKAEDVVKALMSGETILTDDTNLCFKVEKRFGGTFCRMRIDKLLVRDRFFDRVPWNWYHINVDFTKPLMVVEAMDKAIEEQEN